MCVTAVYVHTHSTVCKNTSRIHEPVCVFAHVCVCLRVCVVMCVVKCVSYFRVGVSADDEADRARTALAQDGIRFTEGCVPQTH